MGEVYRAHDSRLKRDVAIKVLPRAFARDAERLARFEREARAASALNHPNIVCVYDIGRADETAWIATELVEGQSLRQLLAKGPLPLRRAIEIARQIADGLAAAHAVGLIHRDLKPENVMVARDGRVKILDFGLAKRNVGAASGEPVSATITRPGMISGTPGYMSPEQIAGRKIDQRSDIFSLGVVTYEMLAGKRPFVGDTPVSLMNAVLTEEPEQLPVEIPTAVARLVHHCFEKEAEHRLQSAADFSFALEGFEGRKLSGPTKRGGWLFPTALAVVAASVAAFGTYWFIGYASKPQNPEHAGKLRRLTWDSGLTTDGAISPDGKFVAYSSDRNNRNNLDIYVQQIDSGGVVRLTDDPADDQNPAFSPDGSTVVFRSERGRGGIFEVSALGGQAHLVVPNGKFPRFSPDGRYLMYAVEGSGGLGVGLYIQALSGGLPVLITKGCDDVQAGAAWSPDSSHVLFIANTKSQYDPWLASIEGKAPVRIANSFVAFNQETSFSSLDQWLANPSRLLLTANERDAEFEATAPVGPGGVLLGPAQRLVFGPARISQGSASLGGRVVLSSFEQTSNLWRIPVNIRGQQTGTAVPLTAGPAESRDPSITLDGKMIAFVTAQSGTYALHVKDLETAADRTLEPGPGYIAGTRFSPKGDRIWYSTWKDGVQTGKEVSTSDGLALTVPSLALSDWSSRDDLLIYGNLSHPVSGGPVADIGHSVYSSKADSSKKSLLLEDKESSLWQVHFSRDGQWVTFNSVHGQHSQLFVIPFRKALVPKNQWMPITDGTHWDDKPQFSSDGKLLFFTSNRDGHVCVWAQRLSADMHPHGDPFAIYHLHSSRHSLSAPEMDLEVARDFLVLTQGERTGNIWLLDPK